MITDQSVSLKEPVGAGTPFHCTRAHQTHASDSPAIPPAIRWVVSGTLGFGPEDDDEGEEEEEASFDRSAGGRRMVGFGAEYRSPVRPPPKGFEVEVDMICRRWCSTKPWSYWLIQIADNLGLSGSTEQLRGVRRV